MNPILRILIVGDLLAMFGYGLVEPVLAIFAAERVVGGSIAAVGFGYTTFLVTKAILQLLVAWYTDGDHGYIREYWTIVAGYAVFTATAFFLTAAHTVSQYYLAQAFHGIGAALAYPGWMVLFTRFADHDREGREWTLYSTIVVIGMSIAASVGGWLVERYGFAPVFLAMGTFGAMSTVVVATLGNYASLLRRDGEPHHRLTHGKTAHR